MSIGTENQQQQATAFCSLCGFSLRSVAGLKIHNRKVHPNGEPWTEKWCSGCESDKPLDAFYRFKDGPKIGRPSHLCKSCANAQSVEYHRSNPEYRVRWRRERYRDPIFREYCQSKGRISRERVKLDVVTHYTGGVVRCMCPGGCDVTDIRFLTIDHVNGDGASQRRRTGLHYIHFFLRKNNYPEGYRVLCYNCNCGRGLGKCPHEVVH